MLGIYAVKLEEREELHAVRSAERIELEKTGSVEAGFDAGKIVVGNMVFLLVQAVSELTAVLIDVALGPFPG
jgi:hypothetical protein